MYEKQNHYQMVFIQVTPGWFNIQKVNVIHYYISLS